MREAARKLVERLTPLHPRSVEERANCFNAIQLCWADSVESTFLGPEEFVAYMQKKFRQVDDGSFSEVGVVSIIWSRSSSILPIGHVYIDDLRKDRKGYPFGLIIEHAFVSIGDGLVFQKRDPTENGPYEIILEHSAVAPYLASGGFEITRHRRR